MNNYSIKFNETEEQFFARFRKIGGDWGTKRIPKRFQSFQALEADQWFISWYHGYLGNGIDTVKVGKNLASYAKLWLQQRDARQDRSSHNYFKMLSNHVHCWILDNEKHPHLSIEGLDMEKDFSIELLRQWMRSIPLSPASVISIAGTLKNLFTDLIVEEKLDPNMVNPLEKKAIANELKSLRALNDQKHTVEGEAFVTTFPVESWRALLDAAAIPAVRRIAYLLALGTGMRDCELRALTWRELDLQAEFPSVKVWRQLLKPGCKPALHYDTERAKKSRKDIMRQENAIVGKPKWNEVRTIPLHSAVVAGLTWWQDKGWKQAVGWSPGADDPVFPRVKSRTAFEVRGWFAHSQSAIQIRLDLTTLDLPTSDGGFPLTFHALRHTFSSLLKSHGVAAEDRGALMGHKPTTTTDKNYTKKDPVYLAGIVAKLPLTWSEAKPVETLEEAG